VTAVRPLLLALLLAALPGAALAQDADEPGAAEGEPKFNLNGLRMTAEVVFDGRIESTNWTCVLVEVENIGDPVDGLLQITPEVVDLTEEPRRYARRVDVGRKARKRVFLYFEATGYGAEWTVNLVDRAGRGSTVAMARFRTLAKEPDDVVVAVVGDDPMGLNVIREAWSGAVPGHPQASSWERRRVLLSLVTPEDMPDRWIGYNVVDVLLWDQADPTGMEEDQLDALAHFVGMGGTLVMPVTDHWQVVRDSALNELLGVDLVGAVEVEQVDPLLRALDLPVVAEPTRSVVIAHARARDDAGLTVRAADGDRVLWSVKEYGLGRVVFLAADPAMYPLKGEVDRATFWRRLLWMPEPAGGQREQISREAYLAEELSGGGATVPDSAYREGPFHLRAQQPISDCIHDADELGTVGNFAFTGSYYYGTSAVDSWYREVRNKLNEIPALKPLPLGWIALFAAIYLLCIGPIDYLLLRVIGRLEWTWITFPILIAVFFVAAVVGTTAAKGRKAVMTRLEVVDVFEPDGVWRGQSYVGVFASQRTSLTLSSERGHSVVSPTRYVPVMSWWGDDESLNEGYMKNPAVQVGPGPGAMAYGADTWTMAYLQSAWVDDGAERGHFSVRRDGDDLISVVNDSDVDLYSALLLYGREPRTELPLNPYGEFSDLFYGDAASTFYTGGWGIHALGPLARGAAAQVNLAEIESTSTTVWPTPPPEAMVRPHDQEDWNHFREMPEFWGERGHVDLIRALMDGELVLVGYSSTPVEGFELEGLDPVSEPRTMVRVVLGDDPRLESLRARQRKAALVEETVLGSPILIGSLDRAQVDDVVGMHLPSIRACYERALTDEGPHLAGQVDIKFVIEYDGTVSSADAIRSTLASPTVESCVASRFYDMYFPPPTGGGIVLVTYPFVFEPG
jgi:hypothetical protein